MKVLLKKFKTNSFSIIIALLLILAGLLAGYVLAGSSFLPGSSFLLETGDEEPAAVRAGVEETQEEEMALRVIGAEVITDYIAERNSFSAVMQPSSEYAVLPRLEGEIERIEVEVGDQVEQGQLLAELDDERYRAELEQAEAGLEAAQAEFARLEEGATDEELQQISSQVEEARISVEGARDEVGHAEEIYQERTPDDMELEQAKNELEQARVQLEMAEKEQRQAELAFEEADDNYQRMASLYEEGAISEQQYNEIKTGRNQAETQLETAKDRVKQAEIALQGAQNFKEMTEELYDFRVEEERMVSQARTQYEAASAALQGAEAMLAEAERGPTEEELKAMEAQVKQARAGVEMARIAYNNIEIAAPADGVIAAVEMDAGEMAAPGNPLFYLVNLDEIKATANVNAPYVGLLETGAEALVKITGLPGEEFTGRISSVAPMAGEQGGFPVEVTVPNPDHAIKVGMRGSVEFVIRESEDALLIPADAVFNPEGEAETAVYLIEDGRARRQTVRTGLRYDNRVEITSGLSEGDQVVLYDQDQLEDGQAVEVVEYESF